MKKPSEFLDALGASVPRATIAGGPEEFLRTECRDALIAALGEGTDVLDIRWGDSETTLDATAIFDELRAVSLFGAPRLIVVRDASDFVAENGAALARLLESGEAATHLWLEDDDFVKKFGKTVSHSSSLKPLIEQGAFLIDCSPLASVAWGMKAPWDHDLARWLIGRAQKIKKTLSPEAAHALTSIEGGGMRALITQLDRLALQAGDRAEITADDVERTITGTKEANVFDLVDGAAETRLDFVLGIVRQMFDVGFFENGKRRLEPAGLVLRLVPLMSQRFHQLGRIRERERMGDSFETAAIEVFGESKRWLFPRYKKQCAARTPRALGDAVLGLGELEYSVKTGADPRRALETFLVTHCRPMEAARGMRR